MRLSFFVKRFFQGSPKRQKSLKSSLTMFLIFPDRPIVVLDFRRKIVGSVILGDEIEIGDRSRVEGRQQRILSGAANGGWRKPGSKIGIIGGRSEQVFSGQISIEILYSIDDRRIALKGHLPGKAIVKDGGDEGFFFGKSGLFLNDRG